MTGGKYDPLRHDERFNALLAALVQKTPWDDAFWRGMKTYGVYQLLRQALLVPGDCFEFGCHRGYSASMLAEMIEQSGADKRVYVFDTFSGMPHSDPEFDNFYKAGDFADTSLELIRSTLAPWDRDGRFEFVQGDICETVRAFGSVPACYVRVDVDLWRPAKAILETMFDALGPGGVVYLDDYVGDKTLGERKAVDDFLAPRPERVFYMPGDRAYIIKGTP